MSNRSLEDTHLFSEANSGPAVNVNRFVVHGGEHSQRVSCLEQIDGDVHFRFAFTADHNEIKELIKLLQRNLEDTDKDA